MTSELNEPEIWETNQSREDSENQYAYFILISSESLLLKLGLKMISRWAAFQETYFWQIILRDWTSWLSESVSWFIFASWANIDRWTYNKEAEPGIP